MTDQTGPAAPPPYPYQPGAAPAAVPGKTLGIVGFILAFVASPIGLILSIVAMVQSKKANVKNGFALAGIIIGALGTIALIVTVILIAAGTAALLEVCSGVGSGMTTTVDGVTITCP